MGKKGKGGGAKPNTKQQKVIQDKTFGLKNKNKSKKVQNYVKTVQSQVTGAESKRAKALERERDEKKRAKELNQQHDMLVASLTKTTATSQHKKTRGADPKSIVCEFFQRGMCKKGGKCKFSHDLSKVRKAAKIDVYSDNRDADTMDTWDDEKLKEVVGKKHGAEGSGQANRTEKVCKHFIEAIENQKYGWFWECPNGGKSCMYRHALPPGFVLKSAQKEEDADEGPSIEEIIEEERKKLSTFTPVTEESFSEWWRKRKEAEAAKKLAETETKKKNARKGIHDGMTGRDLFEHQRDLFVDDEAAGGDEEYVREKSEEDDDAGPAPADDAAPAPAAALDEGLFGGGDDLDDLDDLSES